jgi:hypothetical protein
MTGTTVVVRSRTSWREDPDDFEEELAPVVRVPDEEDDAPARRAGEFVCTALLHGEAESQLAVKSRKVCRDCA